jgi:hypothetical protein
MTKDFNKVVYYVKAKLNSLYWAYSDVSDDIKVIEYSNTKPFKDYVANFEDIRINNSYNYDNKNRDHHQQFILNIRNVTIEPDYGFVIMGCRTILKQSVTHEKLVPSAWRFLKSRKENSTVIPEALLFDGHAGINYFHFFADIINKLWVFENHLNKSLPLIISRNTFNTKYFQDILNVSFMKDLNWIMLEDNKYAKIISIYVVKPRPYELNLWIRTLDLFETYINQNKKRRVFLNREKSKGRFISNLSEIKPILTKYNFEVVDTDNWSLIDQIKLFSETQFLIGIHGAGLTNIMFSFKNKLNVIEINPPNRIAYQYYWLSSVFRFNYNCILGDIIDGKEQDLLLEEGFILCPKKLEQAIEKYLD